MGTRHEASEPASVTFACRIGRLWCLTIGGLLIIVAFAAAILGGLV